MVTDLETLLSDEDRARVNAAIAEAERGTSAEIVPVVTDASGSYDRPEDLFGLVLALLVLSGAWVGFQGIDTATWSGEASPALLLDLPRTLLLVVVTFMIGVALASRSWAIRHLFTPKRQMRDCLVRGAERAFFLHGLGKTRDATGVLIYVSLFERMVYVLGDSTVREALSDEDFEAVKDAIVAGFASGAPADGLVEGVRKAGELLAEHFPIAEDDEDELPDELILFPQGL